MGHAVHLLSVGYRYKICTIGTPLRRATLAAFLRYAALRSRPFCVYRMDGYAEIAAWWAVRTSISTALRK